jgi:predicted dehydrogenase
MAGVGLIGCGWVACEKHLPALARVDDMDVVALHDSAPGAIDRAARLAPAASRHTEIAALVEDPAVDVVAVLTPPTRHAEHSLAAFAAGRAVLCEKPLALRSEDASAICQAAAESGLLGATGLMSRALRVVQRARKAVAEGAIGEVVALQTVYADSMADEGLGDRPWRRQRATGGGALQEKLVHHVDLWRFITGLEVEDARCERIGSSREDDEAVLLTGRMTGGVLASSLGLDRAATANEFRVFGSHGHISLDLYRFDGFRLEGRNQVSGDPSVRLRRAAGAAAKLPSVALQLGTGGEFSNAYVRQWEAFRDGAPLATLEDGRRATDVLVMAAGEPAP